MWTDSRFVEYTGAQKENQTNNSCIFQPLNGNICEITTVFIIIIKASAAFSHYFCCSCYLFQQHTSKTRVWKISNLFQQDNSMVTDDETLLYLLIWLLWSLSCELSVHCVYSELPLASIIIWPRWRAVSCPYAAASTVIVSLRRGFGFWCFADVLCSCLLLLLIELRCSVYIPVLLMHR